MKIIVTGGTGYIGSHTVVELQQDGHEVVIVDNLANSTINVLDGIQGITGTRPAFEKIDLTDRPATLDFFARHKDAASLTREITDDGFDPDDDLANQVLACSRICAEKMRWARVASALTAVSVASCGAFMVLETIG